MIVFVAGATRTPRSAAVGHLIVPRSWSAPATLDLTQPWAMDNGAFTSTGFDEGAYVRMLERYRPYPGCQFVTAPDVVGDAAATLERWPFWSTLLRGLGHTPAFVAQDGLTPERLPELWRARSALFIGGTTAFKEGPYVRALCAFAKARGVWVHWGRVNSERRYALACEAGADSIDGSGFSRFAARDLPKVATWADAHQAQPAFTLES